MKLIVAGSRTFTNAKLAFTFLDQIHRETPISIILCGEAKGADTIGKQWAKVNHIRVHSFYPQWGLYPKSAGYIRNTVMIKAADKVIVFWDGKSSGSKHMIQLAKASNKLLEVINLGS